MAQADPKNTSLARETLERSGELENGCIRAEELEDNSSIFSRSLYSLEEYDSLAYENIAMSPQRSARVLEYYFGQHSRSEEPLSEFLEPFDTGLPQLDNDIVLDLNLYSYEDEGRQQHVKYHEGEVARELIEYLDSDSSWSSQTCFMEDSEKLFIQNSP